MSERTITIPYKEYQELNRFREVMKKNKQKVVVERRLDTMNYHLVNWYVYTSDEYVKKINDELSERYLSEKEGDELRRRNAELMEKIEELKKEPPYKKMFNTLLFFNFLCILAYIIGEYILN